MDFTHFIPHTMIPSLHWLGRRDWIEHGDIPDRRHIWGRPKELVFLKAGEAPSSVNLSILGDDNSQPWMKRPDKIYVTNDEYRRYPTTFWQETQRILQWLNHNVVSTFWLHSLSKSLAEGPKVFRATTQQCLDLASDESEMSCDYPFSDYHQPYPVFILELPIEYQDRLKGMFKTQTAPTHVFCHHEPNKIITVSAFFSIANVVTHLTPNRVEYDTLEQAIIGNRRSRANDVPDPSVYHDIDFDVAETVQRLAINFGMWMTFIGTHVKGPLNPEEYYRMKQMANVKSQRRQKRTANAQRHLQAAMQQFCFNQVVEFHDEIKEVDVRPDHQGGTHRSPKPHRRKAHWRNQACGPQQSERRWIPIKAVMVRKSAFVGDMSQMTSTYITKKKK